MTKTLKRAARGALLVCALSAVAAVPASAQQAARIGQDNLHNIAPYVLDSGLAVEGTIHARLFWRGNPFVQIGYSDLRWTRFTYNDRRYSRRDLVDRFGDRVPDAEITDGIMTIGLFAATNRIVSIYGRPLQNCLGGHYVSHRTSLQLGTRDRMGSDLAGALMSEYTGRFFASRGDRDTNRGERSAEVRACVEGLDADERSIEVWQNARTVVGDLRITDHSFPVPGRLATIEMVLEELFEEEAEAQAREAVQVEAETEADVASAHAGESEVGEQPQEAGAEKAESGTASGRNAEAGGRDRERPARERPAGPPPYLAHLARAQNAERRGDYAAASRHYQDYCAYPDASCDRSKLTQLRNRATQQQINDTAQAVAAPLASTEVSRPHDRPGPRLELKLVAGGLDFGDTGDLMALGGTADMSHRFRNDRHLAILTEAVFEATYGVPGLAGALVSIDQESSNVRLEEDLDAASAVGGRASVGFDWNGIVAMTYDLHAYGFSAVRDNVEFGGPPAWQDGLSLTLGRFSQRQGEMSFRVRSTGQLLMPERRRGEPSLSLVSYEVLVGINYFSGYAGYRTFEFVPEDGRPLAGSMVHFGIGMRLQ